MPETPWKVKSLKRKSSQSTPTTTTKRARLANDVDHPSNQKQQTLTQIDFVQSPNLPLFKDEELEEIKDDKRRMTPSSLLSSSSRRRHLKKRDSTLTQMDFFNTGSENDEEDGYEMLPQVDGARCVDQRPRNQHSNSARKLKKFGLRPKIYSESAARAHGRHTTTKDPSKQLVKKGDMNGDMKTVDSARRLRGLDEPTIVDETDTKTTKPPNTPQKPRRSIPSSQSPESLPPSAMRSKVSPSKNFKRMPLEELSTNIRYPKTLAPTASSYEKKHQHCQASEADSIAVADFGDNSNSSVISHSYPDAKCQNHEPMLFCDEAVSVLPQFTQEDDVSDFGPDIANDTQFISNLFHNTSSPRGSSRTLTDFAPDLKGSSTQEAKRKRPTSSRKVDPQARTSLPPPRLVQTSPLFSVGDQEQILQPEDDLMLPDPLKSATPTVTTTRIPLNDTLSSTQSSSPHLPSTFLATQRSIHPASIPHPSQISTQDPSQSHQQSSCTLQPTVGYEGATQGDGIIITDSSSVSANSNRTSTGDVQKSSRNLKYTTVVNDSEEDDELDFDLDPPETYERNARKPRVALIDSDTQTPTQETVKRSFRDQQLQPEEASPSPSSSSLVVTYASTRAERDAKLEVIELSPSQRPSNHTSLSRAQQWGKGSSQHGKYTSKIVVENSTYDDTDEDYTESQLPPHLPLSNTDCDVENGLPFCSPTSTILSLSSIEGPSPLKRKYSPIPGFDNDTQSNFTQDGHVTAAYIHREREAGRLPRWFTPDPYKVPGWEDSKISRVLSKKTRQEEKTGVCSEVLQWEQRQIKKNNTRPSRAEEKFWEIDFASSNPSQR